MTQRRLTVAHLIILAFLIVFPLYLVAQGYWNREADLSSDIIIHNGVVLTMEQSPAQVEALYIQGESILAIGDESDILEMAESNTRFIDLDGRTLMPGFIDSHAHWIGGRHNVDQSTPEEAIESVLSSGWTSISELFVNQERLDELMALDEQDSLRVRVNAYLVMSDTDGELFGNWYLTYQPGQEFGSRLRIGGVKTFVDTWITNPKLHFNQTELDILLQEAHEAGFQIAIHSFAENGTDMVLNSLESVLGGESNQLYRHRIEHLVLLRDDQIQRMSNLGIVASFQLPWINSDWTQLDEFEILQNHSHLVGRWRDILQAGIPSIGSTDFPWNLGYVRSPMKAISKAVTKIGEEGLSPSDWMLNQTLSVEQALRLVTIGAAYGTFQEDIKGSIKVGKLADLVVLSDNPLTVPEESLAGIEVLMAMVGGVVEYCAPGLDLLCPGIVGLKANTSTTATAMPTITAFLASLILASIEQEKHKSPVGSNLSWVGHPEHRSKSIPALDS